MSGARTTSGEVLVADIGGTNCRLALCKREGGVVSILRRAAYLTGERPSVADAIGEFLGPDLRPAYAAVAVAGPVEGDTIALTNSYWGFSISALEHAFGFTRLVAVNDLVAQAEAAIRLGGDDIASIGGDVTACARLAVVGVGTGLGVASVSRGDDGSAKVTPTEAGHAGFAPFDALDLQIIEQWHAETGRVVDEHLVSGPGLVRLHNTLRVMRNQKVEADLDGREIVRRAFELEDGPCLETVHRFALALASVCADVALVQGAEAVLLVGDVANSLLPELKAAPFRARFEQHGPRRGFLADVPIGVAHAKDLGLIGAYIFLEHALMSEHG